MGGMARPPSDTRAVRKAPCPTSSFVDLGVCDDESRKLSLQDVRKTTRALRELRASIGNKGIKNSRKCYLGVRCMQTAQLKVLPQAARGNSVREEGFAENPRHGQVGCRQQTFLVIMPVVRTAFPSLDDNRNTAGKRRTRRQGESCASTLRYFSSRS